MRRQTTDTSLPTWTVLALVLVVAGSAAAVDRWGGTLLDGRNTPPIDSRLQALGRTLESLDTGLAEHVKARDRLDRQLAKVGGPTRELPGADELLRAATRIEERLAMRPRVLSPFERDVERPTLIDVVHSTAIFHETIRDPAAGPDERARAFVALSRLPYAEAQFDAETIRRWRTEVALAPDAAVLGLLFDVFAWVDAPPEVNDVLIEALARHSSETIRRAAVVALGKTAADPVVHASLVAARSGDASRLVRDEAASVLRKLRYRE